VIGPLPEDIRAERMLEIGSRQLLSAIMRARAGLPTYANRSLVWNERTCRTVRDPNSASFAYTVQAAERFRQQRETAERQRIEPRDPCPVCATRRDIGCEHTRRAA